MGKENSELGENACIARRMTLKPLPERVLSLHTALQGAHGHSQAHRARRRAAAAAAAAAEQETF